MTDRISAALAALEHVSAPASFACRLTLPADALVLSVDGVGRVRLPVAKRRAAALGRVARPAPFGLGERTLHDTSVRDGGEIDAERVQIDEERWRDHLEPALERVREELGLPAGRLEARLHKLLVYGKGQFFLPHRDTERADDMLATLVVVLPSAHRGGALVVEHRGEMRRFVARERTDAALTLLAFYADCTHEVRPVTDGTRVVLSYQLHFTADDSATPAHLTAEEGLSTLIEALESYFGTGTTRERSPYRHERTDKLVCLLDHEYSRRSLTWSRLKGADALHGLALRYAAVALGLRPWLALVDVEEIWHAWEEVASDDYELDELIERTARLEDWHDAKGGRPDFPPLYAWESELARMETLADVEPEHEEFEGYMGNYGDTLERRYRRAAVVLWPTSRHHTVLADMGADVLVHELLRETANGDGLEPARAAVRSIVDEWLPSASADEKLLGDTLTLCARLDDAELASTLLAGFRLKACTPRTMPALIALGERFGARFRETVADRWCGVATSTARSGDDPDRLSRRAESARERLEWLAAFPTFCRLARDPGEALRKDSDGKVGRNADAGIDSDGVGGGWAGVLPTLFERLHAQLREVHAASHRTVTPSRRRAAVGTETGRLVALLDAAREMADPAAATTVLDALREDIDGYEMDVPVRVVEHLASLPPPLFADRVKGDSRGRRATVSDSRVDAAARALRRRTADELHVRLARSERAAGDWRIDVDLGCGCADCRTLGGFLAASEERARDLPLAKAQRRHLHEQISRHELPVTHVTRREGRPYVLQLRKRTNLPALSAREHAHGRTLLERLEAVGKDF